MEKNNLAEENDFYHEYEDALEDDEITPQEEAFMSGYVD